MEEIIAPVDKSLILAELTPDKMMRKTNRGDNEIYVVDWRNAPNTLREIGRLREICFRSEGGSSGLAVDIAAKVVEREVNRQDLDGFVDDFIRNVGEQP